MKVNEQIFVISTLLLLPATTLSQGNEIEGYMRCAVKSNQITAIEDGVPQIYGGIEGEFGKDDDLILEYSTVRGVDVLAVILRDQTRDRGIVFATKSLRRAFGDDLFSDIEERDFIGFGEDDIHLRNSSGELHLSRYYKSDWQGVGIAYPSIFRDLYGNLYAQVYTLDCRAFVDSVDEVVDDIRQAIESRASEEQQQRVD